MTKFSRRLRLAGKRSNKVPAVIVDISGKKGTVKLSGNGTMMHNLTIIGGPVEAGDLVEVDFSSTTPVILAYGNIQNILSSLDIPASTGGGLGFTWEILAFNNGTCLGSFGVDSSALDAALAAAGTGGVVLVPAVTIADDHTIPDGVSLVGLSRKNTVLQGIITAEGDGGLENLTIDVTNEGSTSTTGLEGNGTGYFTIQNCDIFAESTGSGFACGVHDGGLTVKVFNSHLSGISASGQGFAAWSSSGEIYFYGGKCYGSTDVFLVY